LEYNQLSAFSKKSFTNSKIKIQKNNGGIGMYKTSKNTIDNVKQISEVNGSNFSFKTKKNSISKNPIFETIQENELTPREKDNKCTYNGEFQIQTNIKNIFNKNKPSNQSPNSLNDIKKFNPRHSPSNLKPIKANVLNLNATNFSIENLKKIYSNNQESPNQHFNQINVFNNIDQSVINFANKNNLNQFKEHAQINQEQSENEIINDQSMIGIIENNKKNIQLKKLFLKINQESQSCKGTQSSKKQENQTSNYESEKTLKNEKDSVIKTLNKFNNFKSSNTFLNSELEMIRTLDDYESYKNPSSEVYNNTFKESTSSDKTIMVSGSKIKRNKSSRVSKRKDRINQRSLDKISSLTNNNRIESENTESKYQKPVSNIHNQIFEKLKQQNNSFDFLYDHLKNKSPKFLKNKEIKEILSDNMRNISLVKVKNQKPCSRKSVSVESNKFFSKSKNIIIPKSNKKKKKSSNFQSKKEKNYCLSIKPNYKSKFNTMKISKKRSSRKKKNAKHSSSVEIDIKTQHLINSKLFKTSNFVKSKKSIDSNKKITSLRSLEKNNFQFNNQHKASIPYLADQNTFERVHKTNRSISNNSESKSKSFDNNKKIIMRLKSKNCQNKSKFVQPKIFSSFNRSSNKLIKNKYGKKKIERKKLIKPNGSKYSLNRKSRVRIKGSECGYFTKKYS
jgi:hypothetical protein